MDKFPVKKLFTTYGKSSNTVTYEYRGKTYDVEYANDWTYCVSSPRTQHELGQHKIDEEIEREKAESEKPHRYEDTAEYGFNLLWDWFEKGE